MKMLKYFNRLIAQCIQNNTFSQTFKKTHLNLQKTILTFNLAYSN